MNELPLWTDPVAKVGVDLPLVVQRFFRWLIDASCVQPLSQAFDRLKANITRR